MPKTILTISDIAEILKIGKNAAYDLVKQPDFPHFKVGKRIRTTEDALIKWMEEQQNLE
jgi:excisionase family DNA binding protein